MNETNPSPIVVPEIQVPEPNSLQKWIASRDLGVLREEALELQREYLDDFDKAQHLSAIIAGLRGLGA